MDIFDDETCAASMDNTHHICFGAMSGGACNVRKYFLLKILLMLTKERNLKIIWKYQIDEGHEFYNLFNCCLQGDSGTALLVDNIQVGIASFITNKCGIATKKHPNVYSRVPTYYNWILDVISSKN